MIGVGMTCIQKKSRSKFLLFLLLSGALCALTVVRANDTAANYSQSQGNWVSGAHRGTYDSAEWTLEAVSESWSAAGHFIGDSTFGAADINTDGKSFGMFANPAGDPNPFAAAVKRFAQPVWRTGDTVSFQVAVRFRNGDKGFNLRDADGNHLWLFRVRNDAYQINGTDIPGFAYHADTIFTFTFTQHPRHLAWSVDRTGGRTESHAGTSSIQSGTIADIRFYINGTEAGNNNNLYFNNFTFTAAPRGDAPLTLGERRFPGYEPSYFLRFEDPDAGFVNFHSKNN